MNLEQIPDGAISTLITIFNPTGTDSHHVVIFKNREAMERSAIESCVEDGPNFMFFVLSEHRKKGLA